MMMIMMNAGEGRRFERFVLAAVALDLVKTAMQFNASAAVHGTESAVISGIAAPLLAVGLALAISRLGSRLAACAFVILSVLALHATVLDGMSGWLSSPAYWVGLAGLALEFAALFVLGRAVAQRRGATASAA